jgi:hypothetical protein
MLTRLRIRLSDRPGSLARVTGVLGRAGVDIHQVTVLERGDGRALDDLVIALPAAMLPGAIARALTEIPGVRVEGCWQTGNATAGGTELEVLTEVLTSPARALEALVEACPRLLNAHWAAALAPAGNRVVYASWRAPKIVPGDLAPLRPRGFTAPDGTRLVLSPLGDDLVVLVGRRNAPPFHGTELDRLATLASTVSRLSAGHAPVAGRRDLALVTPEQSAR